MATLAGLLTLAVMLLLARSLLNNYLLETGIEQANAMNLPTWATTPVSWIIGACLMVSVASLFRFFTTGSLAATDRWWLAALLAGALLVNFVSFHNTPQREACNETDACFGPKGQPLRWYSEAPDGRIVLWGAGGRHPVRNTLLLPITPEIIERWQRQDNRQTAAPSQAAATVAPSAKRTRP